MQYAWNDKSYFLEKKKKLLSNLPHAKFAQRVAKVKVEQTDQSVDVHVYKYDK